MFKFNFDLDEEEVDDGLVSQLASDTDPTGDSTRSELTSQDTGEPFLELELDGLLAQLPGVISYSPVHVPSLHASASSAEPTHIAKRDLYDARFQLIAAGVDAGDDGADRDLQYVEAPSDLVPGVYEGGLKTWECSVDLAACVRDTLGDTLQSADRLRTLELGCGTAVPSLMLLRTLFAQPPRADRRIELHLQDYNELVFRLVTLPNLVLAWYTSPASASFIASFTPTPTEQDAEPEPLPPADATQAGDLALGPALLAAFKDSLTTYGITLRLFAGAWEAFPSALTATRYDIVLTSETIYRTASLAPLTDLLWRACTASADRRLEALETSAAHLTLQATNNDNISPEAQEGSLQKEDPPVCLVAAKLVYFGVGGGVAEFTRAVENGEPSHRARGKGTVETLWKREEGVKRVVLRVTWQ